MNELEFILDVVGGDAVAGQRQFRPSQPPLWVVLHPRWHLICILLLNGREVEVSRDIERMARDTSIEELLAQGLEELERLVDAAGVEESVAVEALLLIPGLDRSQAESTGLATRIPMDNALFRDDLAAFPGGLLESRDALAADAFARLRMLLFPDNRWERVRLVSDSGRPRRQVVRASLDENQQSAAWGLGYETIAIQGAPGSGKSLVLAARAAWLARTLEPARIAVICLNRPLLEPLRHWLDVWTARDSASIEACRLELMCLNDLLQRHSIELDLFDLNDADHRCGEFLRTHTLQPDYDAILVDEAQDIGAVLLKLVQQLVIPGRGGLTFGFDREQNVRRRPPIVPEGFLQPTWNVNLHHAYRTTASIQIVARHFGRDWGSSDVPVAASSPEQRDDSEEPVRLVWTETAADAGQMIVRESQRLMSELALSASDILVVAFDSHLRREIADLFQRAGIAVAGGAMGNGDGSADAIVIGSPEHVKGMEGCCVFAVGWDRPGGKSTQQDAIRRYVACTRASDILYLVYSRQDSGTEWASDCGPAMIRQLWPDDFQ